MTMVCNEQASAQTLAKLDAQLRATAGRIAAATTADTLYGPQGVAEKRAQLAALRTEVATLRAEAVAGESAALAHAAGHARDWIAGGAPESGDLAAHMDRSDAIVSGWRARADAADRARQMLDDYRPRVIDPNDPDGIALPVPVGALVTES